MLHTCTLHACIEMWSVHSTIYLSTCFFVHTFAYIQSCRSILTAVYISLPGILLTTQSEQCWLWVAPSLHHPLSPLTPFLSLSTSSLISPESTLSHRSRPGPSEDRNALQSRLANGESKLAHKQLYEIWYLWSK